MRSRRGGAGGVKGGIVLGISAPEIRSISKEIKINHPLALELWQKEYHEARMIATLIADKNEITSKQMDAWTEDFDNWAIVDAACYNLYRYTPFAEEKIFQYCKSEKEYIRRTSFSLIAGLAIGVKKASMPSAALRSSSSLLRCITSTCCAA